MIKMIKIDIDEISHEVLTSVAYETTNGRKRIETNETADAINKKIKGCEDKYKTFKSIYDNIIILCMIYNIDII